MARRKDDAEPSWWPEHLRVFRSGDGWESEFEWKIARTRWARSQGYKKYRVLPLIQAMTTGSPAGAEDNDGGV